VVEGAYKVEATLIKDGVSRKYSKKYSVKLEEISFLSFLSFFDYLYAIYEQRNK
jgi:hypothetical protein